jgi:hypothetical protein
MDRAEEKKDAILSQFRERLTRYFESGGVSFFFEVVSVT